MKYSFARRLDKIELSGIRRIFELARGLTDAVDLSIGQPDFDVPEPVRAAARHAIDTGHNRYTVTQGIPALRERLADGLGVAPEGVMITAGASGALFLSLTALVEEGVDVLMADPYFAGYRHLVCLTGGRPVRVDTYPDFRLTVERLERAVTPQTRVLLLNSPANPTGVAYGRDEMKSFAAFARKHALVVISDEIYDAFVYDRAHEPMRPHYEHTITVGGFSKTYAVPGWRLGWCCGPPEIVERMIGVQQVTYVNPNSPAQQAALAMLDTDMSEWIDPYRRKRDLAYDGLRERFEVVRPEGSFYIFPKVPSGDGEAFVKRGIERRVLTVPGAAFSERDTHFRVSFAADDETLKRGIELLRELA